MSDPRLSAHSPETAPCLMAGEADSAAQADSSTSQDLPHPVCHPGEADLLARVRDGDHLAFAQIYSLHKRRIYSLCLRMVGNVSEAEDLTQEAFLQLHRKIATFRGDSAFSTWLHALDLTLTGSIDRMALERAVKDLPAGYRIVFVLHDIEGYGHPEIASMLDCSIGNSKSQLHKARLKLRDALRSFSRKEARR